MHRKKTKKVYRDASTGEFVSKEYADENPNTTVADTVPVNTNESADAPVEIVDETK